MINWQITDEIRAAFPRIICQHQLIEAWACKIVTLSRFVCCPSR